MRIFTGVVVAVVFLLAGSPVAAQETVWFVVAENPIIQIAHGDSYLLPLSRPEDIADARRRIAEGPDSGVGSIATVTIAAGGDGFNRDVRGAGTPAWSWHVIGFGGFGDFAIELCDGWPTFVEQDVQAFIANTAGEMCLWDYSVVAELDAPPDFAISEGLNGAWTNTETLGQGMFVDVVAEAGKFFLGWFTYGTDGPTERPGDEHAWMTAQGTFQGDTATLDAFLTTGGRFDDPAPVSTRKIGQVTVTFSDCDHGSVQYNFDDGRTGTFALARIASRPSCVTRVGDGVARKRDTGLGNGNP